MANYEQGYQANLDGAYESTCPHQGQAKQEWTDGWNDAQIDREIWEDRNHDLACVSNDIN